MSIDDTQTVSFNLRSLEGLLSSDTRRSSVFFRSLFSKKRKESLEIVRNLKFGETHPTYRDPLISVVDPDIVPLPGDGGFGVTSGGNALHHRWLARRHHHIAGGLTKVVSQNCKNESEFQINDTAFRF